MLAQITSAFSELNINIENLANGSKGDVAYTIVETSDMPNDQTIESIMTIDGVYKVKCY
jgi:D-3-phosphoglycerate dehydrogenase